MNAHEKASRKMCNETIISLQQLRNILSAIKTAAEQTEISWNSEVVVKPRRWQSKQFFFFSFGPAIYDVNHVCMNITYKRTD